MGRMGREKDVPPITNDRIMGGVLVFAALCGLPVYQETEEEHTPGTGVRLYGYGFDPMLCRNACGKVKGIE